MLLASKSKMVPTYAWERHGSDHASLCITFNDSLSSNLPLTREETLNKMESKENDSDYKMLRILIDNEIDLKILIEYFERFNQNLIGFQKQLEGTGVSAPNNAMATNEFLKFVDMLKRIEVKYPAEVKKFIHDGIDPDVKFELMLQNGERLIWFLELERKKRK